VTPADWRVVSCATEITSHMLNGMFEVDSDTWQLGNVEGDRPFLCSEDAHANSLLPVEWTST